MRAKITIGKLKVAEVAGENNDAVISEAGSYFLQYVDEFLSSDAKTMTLKLEKRR